MAGTISRLSSKLFAAMLLVSAGARAQSVGDLSYVACSGQGPSCTAINSPNPNPIKSPSAVAASPDGSSVYAVPGSNVIGAVAHFRRQTNGQLTYAGCIGNGVAGCASTPPQFYNFRSVVSLSDSVYVLSAYLGDVLHFRRASNGDLTYAGCIGVSAACTSSGFSGMSAASELTASADGKNVYVTSTAGSGAVAVFNRDTTNGNIGYAGCIGEGVSGCAVISGASGAVRRPTGVSVSPGGGSVYVVSSAPGVISHFRRAANGSLSFGGCMGRSDTWWGVSGCTLMPSDNPIEDATDVRVSPDQTSVYVTSNGRIAHFRRAATGDLSYGGCIGHGFPGCTDIGAVDAMNSALSVALSGDNLSVYVSSGVGAVSHYRRASNGDLSYAGCIGYNVLGCTSVSALSGMGWATGLVAAPFNTSLYVVGSDGSVSGSGAVYQFNRLSL